MTLQVKYKSFEATQTETLNNLHFCRNSQMASVAVAYNQILAVKIPICCIEKSSLDIFPNISFWV